MTRDLEEAKAGSRRSLARTLTSIENRSITIQQALSVLGPVPQSQADTWQTLALTGAPGVGKSCLLDGLLTEWASQGLRIAVLAVDPSSPRTGGALLGDRVRMTVVDNEKLKQQICLRSVATRKASCSVPVIVEDMTKILLSLGWERVVIETVGAGQSEVRCAALADRIVVVEGLRGDGIQAEKAGLLELADAVLVNKSDLPGAELHSDEIRESFELELEHPLQSCLLQHCTVMEFKRLQMFCSIFHHRAVPLVLDGENVYLLIMNGKF